VPESDTESHVVLFSLHGEYYAMPVDCVREIVRYVAPAATAAARGVIQGMVNLRGRVLPIVDLSSRLGKRLEIGSGTRILVLELANGSLGLIVDSVDGVVRIPAQQIEPLPAAVADNGFGDRGAALDERLILLVDPERALGDVLPPPPAAPKPSASKPTARKRAPAKPAAPRAATKPTAARSRRPRGKPSSE
jgi:purine-binding chemotaxis protein CheW